MDDQRDKQLDFQPSVSQRLRQQWFLVVDHRPRPQEEEEEGSGCMSVLLQLSSLNGLSGGEDKHQDASRLEPPTRLLCLGVSSHFLFGHFGDFKFIPNLRPAARREANTAREKGTVELEDRARLAPSSGPNTLSVTV